MMKACLLAALAALLPAARAQSAPDALPYRLTVYPASALRRATPPSGAVPPSGLAVTVAVNPDLPRRPLANPFKTIAELNRHGEDVFRGNGALPYIAVGIAALATDETTIRWFHPKKEGERRTEFAKTFSAIGLEGVAGTTAALLVFGGRHERDTGKLMLAAVGNAGVVTQAIKLITGKKRPGSSNDKPSYHPLSGFQNDSFPSGHTSSAASAAVILGHQYPALKLLFYTLAAGVGAARVQGHNHFPSDVYWGAGVGYYGAHQALRYRETVVTWRF